MPTYQTYRFYLGRALNDWAFYGAGSATVTSVTIVELSTPGYVATPPTLPLASVNRYDGMWIFDQVGNQQRRARHGGFHPLTGTIDIDPGWIAPHAADRIEISSLFPVIEQVSTTDVSYRTLINRALSRLLVPDRIQFAIVPGQTAYDLSAYATVLDRPERLGWPSSAGRMPQPTLLEPHPFTGNPVPSDWRRPTLRMDAEHPYLDIEAPFAPGTSGTLSLNIVRPSDSLTSIDGGLTWGQQIETRPGLFADTDQAKAAVNDVLTVALAEAYDALANRSPALPNGNWAEKAAAQWQRARGLRWFDQTQAIPPQAVAPGQAA